MTAAKQTQKAQKAPAYAKQYAIRHKPSGEMFKGSGMLSHMRGWNPGNHSGPWRSGSDAGAVPGRPKLYKTLGAARTALQGYSYDISEMEVVELSLHETGTHGPHTIKSQK